MELRHLRHYAVLADTLSFTDAARILGMSQPALSASIRALESDLGAALVDRSSRRVTLTPAGQRLRPEARRLLDLAGALPGLARSSPETVTGTVALGIVQAIGHLGLASLLSQLRAAHPGLGFRVSQDTMTRMRQQLRDGTLDLAFLYDSGRGTAGLRTTALYEERLVVIVPETHDLATRRRVGIDALRGQPWVDFAPESDLAAAVAALDREYHLNREVTAQVTQLDILADLVRSGLGIAIAPDTASVPGTVALELAGQPLRRSLVLAHRNEPLSPAAAVVAERIVTHTGNRQTALLP